MQLPCAETMPQVNRTDHQVPAYAQGWAFFLDVDGTLLELADRPDAVSVSPDLTKLLAGLAATCNGALALISGRAARDLDRMFAPLQLAVAGQHGVERRDVTGTLHRHAFPDRQLQDVANRLRAFVDEHPGLLLEDKGCSLALHFRRAPELADRVRIAVERAASELGADFEVMAGKFVHELKPGGRDKGLAIREFLSEAPFTGTLPVFLGDDVTDEFGFATVNRMGGHSVKVGPGHSVAHWRLPDAAAVRLWLTAYVEWAETQARQP
jgi:trehalose 6-phosphate phosphatase